MFINGSTFIGFVIAWCVGWVSSLQDSLSRRDLIRSAPSLVAPWILPVSASADERGHTYVVTGSTSGIGLEACKQLAQNDKNTLVMAGRTMAKAQAAVQLVRESSSKAQLVPAECNLASMKSIESFAKSLGKETIDTLCLNAGLSRYTKARDCARTDDGYELTVGVNHFGHFYLNHLVLPQVSRRIVVTASGVHDPESPGGAQGETASLGDLQGLESKPRGFEMIDGGSFNADKAYKDSKAFDVAVDLFNVGETPEWGGEALAYMTTVSTQGEYYLSPPGSSKYGSSAFGNQFTVSPVSKEAQDTDKGKRLWDLTASSLGIATV